MLAFPELPLALSWRHWAITDGIGAKSFFDRQGVHDRSVKKHPFGHNLVNLYETAKQCGLLLSIADADKFLAWANEYHDRDARIRYEFTKIHTRPMAETLIPIVAALIEV